MPTVKLAIPLLAGEGDVLCVLHNDHIPFVLVWSICWLVFALWHTKSISPELHSSLKQWGHTMKSDEDPTFHLHERCSLDEALRMLTHLQDVGEMRSKPADDLHACRMA